VAMREAFHELLTEVARTLKHLVATRGVGVDWGKVRELASKVEDYARIYESVMRELEEAERREWEEIRLKAAEERGRVKPLV